MKPFPQIAVLVSSAQHPVSARPIRSASDAAAFELGCRLAPLEQITVLHAGAAGKDALSDYFGLGAPEIEVLQLPLEHDIAPALAARLQGYDIVLCGARADGQSASGLLPYLLAERLRMPMIADVLDASLQGCVLSVRQFLPKGLRRKLEVSGPVLLAVHARAAQNRQYAYARVAAGRIKAGLVPDAAPPFLTAPCWQLEPATRRARPLQAKIAQSGHSRMLGAIGSDAGGGGGEVVKQGNAVEKAQVLLAYLREHHLVDF